MPSKEGVGVCLHLPREGVLATVVKLDREQERKKGVEEGRGIVCRGHEWEEGAWDSKWGLWVGEGGSTKTISI